MAKRGKTPSLITGSSGKPSSTVAQRQRECSRCGSGISMGTKLYTIPKLGSGFSQKKPYCKNCFDEILVQTQKDLDELKML